MFHVHGLVDDLGISGIQGWQVLCSSPSDSKLSMERDFSTLQSLKIRGSHSFPIVIISAEIQGSAHLLVNQSTVLDTLPPESS